MKFQPTINLDRVLKAAPSTGEIQWPAMQPGQWVTTSAGNRGRFLRVSKANVIHVDWNASKKGGRK